MSVFPTNLGWCGLAGTEQSIADILIGHSDAQDVRRALAARWSARGIEATPKETDWRPALRRALERYARGERIEFDDVALELPPGTPFQKRILAATRRIAYGRTISYGELAARAGFPRAARAVGSVMAQNRFPIVIPCHRVIAAAGKLGGYSAPQGPDLKARLLALEAGN